MDAAANPDEVRLRDGSSLQQRLIQAGAGAAILLILAPGLLTWAAGGRPFVPALWFLPIGLLLIGYAAFERNIVWIITPDGIFIGQQRLLGKVGKRLIDRPDIEDIIIRKSRFGMSFSLACRLASGEVVISPPLPDITRINETAAMVAGMLGVPDPVPVDNPLEIGNAEITIGSRLNSALGRVIRVAVPVVAILCTLPFLIALWMGESELALGLLLPLGFLIGFALYRFMYRRVGAFWIVGRGEIRIERLGFSGKLSSETIGAGEIAAIEVDEPDPKLRTCTISIRLHAGRTFQSPTRHDEKDARAIRAEIIRRLNAVPHDHGT